MRTIKQRGNKDCGAACVAMLARVPYRLASQALYQGDLPFATQTLDIKRSLERLGVRTAAKRVSFFGRSYRDIDLPFDALIYCNYRMAADEAHWIVCDSRSKRLRDPG